MNKLPSGSLLCKNQINSPKKKIKMAILLRVSSLGLPKISSSALNK